MTMRNEQAIPRRNPVRDSKSGAPLPCRLGYICALILASLGAIAGPALADDPNIEVANGHTYNITLSTPDDVVDAYSTNNTQKQAVTITATVKFAVGPNAGKVAPGVTVTFLPSLDTTDEGQQDVITNAQGVATYTMHLLSQLGSFTVTASADKDAAKIFLYAIGGDIAVNANPKWPGTTNLFLGCVVSVATIFEAHPGQPAGTTYSWQLAPAAGGQATIETLADPSQVAAIGTARSKAYNDLTLQLTYHLHAHSSKPATIGLTVHTPSRTTVTGDPASTWVTRPGDTFRDANGNYNWELFIDYTLKTQLGLTIPFVVWKEIVTFGDDSYQQSAATDAHGAAGTAQGTAVDHFGTVDENGNTAPFTLTAAEVAAIPTTDRVLDATQDVFVEGCHLWENQIVFDVVGGQPVVTLTLKN